MRYEVNDLGNGVFAVRVYDLGIREYRIMWVYNGMMWNTIKDGVYIPVQDNKILALLNHLKDMYFYV